MGIDSRECPSHSRGGGVGAQWRVATPHIGYVSRGLYERFYRDTTTSIALWLDERAATANITSSTSEENE